jgi:predicted transcriptional regulator
MAKRDDTISERDRKRLLAELDAGLERGMADSAAGRFSPAEEVLDRLEARYRNWPAKKAKGSRRA